MRQLKKGLREKEVEARTAAGLTPVRDNPNISVDNTQFPCLLVRTHPASPFAGPTCPITPPGYMK
jgi:hypothetical protein